LEPEVKAASSFAGWVLLAWGMGAALTLASTALGLVSLWRLGRSASPVDDDRAIRILGQLACQLGLARAVRLVRTDKRAMPMTWGVLRPVILLPDDARSWTEDRLRAVLAHELAHVTRGDCLTRLFARMVRALYWFNPLAWVAESRIRAEQECASDDLALSAGVGPCEYAEHLLAVTMGHSAGAVGSAVALALAMATPNRIESRLRSILDSACDRRPASRRQAWLTIVAASVVAFPLAIGRLEAAAPTTAADEPAAKKEASQQPGDANELTAEPAALLEKVRELYVKPTDQSKLAHGAIHGMIAALNDPYSSYLPPEQFADLGRQLEGKLTGIGARLEMKGDRLTVTAPIENAPAHKAGVLAGDVIL